MAEVPKINVVTNYGQVAETINNNYDGPPRIRLIEIGRTADAVTLQVAIEPAHKSVPYLTVMSRHSFSISGMSMWMNHQTGTLGDGRAFEGFANPIFPLQIQVATTGDPQLEFAPTPVMG